jgi:purine-nucleoside phosphorylase
VRRVTALDRDVKESAAFVAKKMPGRPRVAVVLGSGLGAFADSLEKVRTIPYAEIPHFPTSTAPGHAGRLCLGRVEGVETLAMQGRVHYYEGYSLERVTFPIRVLAALGARSLVVTNASGAVNPHFRPGDLVVLEDQINLMLASPLARAGRARFGEAFVDLSDAYDPESADAVFRAGLALGLPMRRGVACAATGPSYETPAEIRMMRRIGADTVSMSTIPEVVVARSLGVRVLGISCVTNLASGVSAAPLSHDVVLETTARAAAGFVRLLRAAIPIVAR